MKNLKFLSFVLLFCVLIVSWCEKNNNSDKLSCDGGEVCSIEDVVENWGIIINDTPSVIVDENDELDINWDWEELMEGEVVDGEQLGEAWLEEPLMRKMVVDEEIMTPEEIEISVSETCEALWWAWIDWECTLEDGSKIYF